MYCLFSGYHVRFNINASIMAWWLLLVLTITFWSFGFNFNRACMFSDTNCPRNTPYENVGQEYLLWIFYLTDYVLKFNLHWWTYFWIRILYIIYSDKWGTLIAISYLIHGNHILYLNLSAYLWWSLCQTWSWTFMILAHGWPTAICRPLDWDLERILVLSTRSQLTNAICFWHFG